MKRIRVRAFGGPEVLELEDGEELRPGAGEVLVRIEAAGVNPADTYGRAGAYGARNPALPFTPGTDGAGVVEAIGAGVTGVSVGERVYTARSLSGTYAQQALCAPSQVWPLPGNTTFAQGAALFVPYGTAYRALFQLAHAQPGETVLVHGASGGVGIAAVQMARAAGLRVIGTAGSPRGLAAIDAEGAHVVIDHGALDHLERVLAATQGRGVDVVVEMVAHKNLARDLTVMAPGGRLIVVGSRGDISITPRDLMARELTVIGMLLWNTPERDVASLRAAIYAGLQAGTLRPLIGLELPLGDAAEAHRRIAEPSGGSLGKIVLLPYA